MLRNKALTQKLLLLGVDGMDPRFTKRMVEEGKMPNFKKLMDISLKKKRGFRKSTTE